MFRDSTPQKILDLLAARYSPVASENAQHLIRAAVESNKLDEAFRLLTERIKESPGVAAVSQDVWARLQAADEAIEYTRGCFPLGAGNQLEAQWHSGGRASTLSDLTKKTSQYKQVEGIPGKTLTSRQAGEWARKLRDDARVARLIGGGTCAYYAAVAFQYLLAKNLRWPLATVTMTDHTFVVIGDLATEDDADLVAVDAWPTVPQALTMAAHFSGGKARVQVRITSSNLPPAEPPKPDELEKRTLLGLEKELGALQHKLSEASDDDDLEETVSQLSKDIEALRAAEKIKGISSPPVDSATLATQPGISFVPSGHKDMILVRYAHS
jgi:hypothetical protein